MAGLFENYNPIQRLAANQYGVSTKAITRGSLISFHYPMSYAIIPNIIHDPYPLVIITDIWPRYIRGLNLHYLTFPYVKRILTTFGGRPFNYQMHVKPDRYMANAFRMYVRGGIRQPKRLDTEWLTTVLDSVRSFSPGEIEKIRMNIQKQIQQRLQAKANELTSYEQWRAQLNQPQQRQLQGKTQQIQDMLTSGVNQNLVYPNQIGNQLPQPGEGGPISTDPNL